MANAFFIPKKPTNEVVKDYKIGSPERNKLLEALELLKSEVIEIPMVIGEKRLQVLKKLKLWLRTTMNTFWPILIKEKRNM